MALVFMVHPCGTSMTMTVTSYIILGTLQYTDHMIFLGQPTPAFLTHISGVPTVTSSMYSNDL